MNGYLIARKLGVTERIHREGAYLVPGEVYVAFENKDTELTAYKDIARKLAEALERITRGNNCKDTNCDRGNGQAAKVLKEYEQLSQDNSGEKE